MVAARKWPHREQAGGPCGVTVHSFVPKPHGAAQARRGTGRKEGSDRPPHSAGFFKDSGHIDGKMVGRREH